MAIRPPETVNLWDVTKHGVMGDGTTNDSAACQTVFSSAAAAGAVVYFPKKTYRIADVWTPSNTHVIFAAGSTFKLPTSGVTTTDPCHFRFATSDRLTGTVTNIVFEGGPITSDMSEVGSATFPGIPRSIHMLNVSGFSTENLIIIGSGLPPSAGNVYVLAPNTHSVAPMNGVVGGGRNINVRGIGSSFIQNLGCKNVQQKGAVYVDGGVALRNEMDGNTYTAENVSGYGPYSSDGASGFGNTLIYFIPHANKMKNMYAANGRATGGVHGVKIAYDTGNTPDSLDGIVVEHVHVTGGGQLLVSYDDMIPKDFTMRGCTGSGSSVDGVTAVPGNYYDVHSDSNTGYGFAQNGQPNNLYPRRYYFDAACRANSNTGGSGFSLTDAQGKVYFDALASEPNTGGSGANLLTGQQQGLETASSTSGWNVFQNATIAWSSAQAHGGTASLLVTATGTGTIGSRTNSGLSGIAVTSGEAIYAEGWMRAVGTTRLGHYTLRWFDTSGALITDTQGVAQSVTSSAWIKNTVSGTAPASGYVALMAEWTGAAISDAFYTDDHVVRQSVIPAVQNYGITQTGGTTMLGEKANLGSNLISAYTRSGGTISQVTTSQVSP